MKDERGANKNTDFLLKKCYLCLTNLSFYCFPFVVSYISFFFIRKPLHNDVLYCLHFIYFLPGNLHHVGI